MSNDIRWRISVPTPIINTKDDGLAAFENAARAAERIPRASVRASRRQASIDELGDLEAAGPQRPANRRDPSPAGGRSRQGGNPLPRAP